MALYAENVRKLAIPLDYFFKLYHKAQGRSMHMTIISQDATYREHESKNMTIISQDAMYGKHGSKNVTIISQDEVIGSL
jgi:hypothetical protein